ncbi:hypothetical protein ACH4RA_32765 [Streptomyces smyrnaeus]|uniref:hypothetical protein n=1 Tax=Streptomyces smyrnaeus TaxID=1387713 RepID=UPI0037A89AC7
MNTVDGRVRTRNVAVGDQLWTLEGSFSPRSVVSSVTVRKERELVTVTTDHTSTTEPSRPAVPKASAPLWACPPDSKR